MVTTPRNASLACPSHMDRERKTIAATMEPPEATHRSRLAETYVRYAPDGIRLAYLLTGDRALAEDLVHEAFLRFVGRLHFLRDPERSYLAREAGRVPDVRNDPDVPTYESMRSALLSLPVRQRAAIVFRYYEDLPEAQIADILGCRPATVRSLVSRGLETLRRNPEVMA